MGKRVGNLIKKARTDAGLTQEQLARKVKGVSATDISNAERGNIELTTQNLKDIAKATGVTQASLLNATGTTAKKTTSSRSTTRSTSTAAKSSMQVTATEKKLINLYRDANSDTKKRVMSILKGTEGADIIGDVVQTAVEGVLKKVTGKK